MIGLFKKIFGPGINYKEIYTNGATILDVRTKGEYASGHITKSINIPLDRLDASMDKIKALPQPIITCCASGMRSGVAKNKLKTQGIEVFNGGGWSSLNQKIK